ncbi:TetR/AcrR family transcriptional regulator [Sinosporangium siamense]|uniref:TetR family transcriptional regulator n=1 Tax=Sinosporangium siamense TaxID=1367973 RepID=A0A919RMG3_9ACTN|nr:TetR/AcrR family transcriptional regulator [Sinosporangium siamense]GII95892.1 TetR family transcriptional regulator [Sinosporangium siamense]
MAPINPAPLRADARRNRERIIIAAEAVFAEHGASASTEEVAARAGVAIGTVFRHFPTKSDLLGTILKRLVDGLTAEAADLAEGGDPAEALFTFVTRVVEEAAAKRTVAGLLADSGVEVETAKAVAHLQGAIETLLGLAQRAGAVRAEIRPDEVTALLAGLCQAALQAGWGPDLRRRTLAIVFAGLRTGSARI